MPTARIPFVGSLINRNEDPISASEYITKDQLFEECYPEVVKNPITGQGKAYLNKRPGLTGGSAVSAGATGAYGACVWNSNSAATSPVVLSFLKTGGSNMQVFTTAGLQVGGDIANTKQCASLTDTVVGTTGNLVGIFADSSTIALEAWFFPEAGAWTQITDADFPPNLGTAEPLTGEPVHMDGFMFMMTTNGKIWNSDLNSLSAWTANSFTTAQSMPDGGVGLARYKNLVVAFGKYSTEFFYNAGNATGSPLLPISNALIRIGAFQSTSATKIRAILPFANTVYWMGVDSESGRRGVYRLNGYQAEKVSNAYIEKYLNSPALDPASVVGLIGAFTAHGMSHIALKSSNIQFIFCVDTGIWWISNNTKSVYIGTANASYAATPSDAKVYTVASATYTDEGNPITQIVQTEKLDFGTDRRKFWKSLRLIGDTQASTSNIGISWSDDDYGTFSTPVNIDMSSAEKQITRLAESRRRSFKFTHSANIANRLEAFELTYDLGNS